jgi:hypothetical protein
MRERGHDLARRTEVKHFGREPTMAAAIVHRHRLHAGERGDELEVQVGNAFQRQRPSTRRL